MINLNEKLSEVQHLRLRATFHALPLFYFRSSILRKYARENYATLEINTKREFFPFSKRENTFFKKNN